MSPTAGKNVDIRPATGKLGILLPGMGAVATTFIAGVEAIRRGMSKPIGSLTQKGTIRLGKRTDARTPLINEFVPLAKLEDVVFGGWDLFPDNAYEAAKEAGVLSKEHLDELKEFLSTVRPMTAVFDQGYVKNLTATHAKTGKSKRDLADQVIEDIKGFKKTNGCERLVMVWCGSTEVYRSPSSVHASLAAFEKGLEESDPEIAPSQIYAYAALKCGVPYANGAPNLTVDVPALLELAKKNGVPVTGKDFKTGQTLMKTILAPGFKARLLGVEGWYSTNILGNRDGEVLDDPESFKSKEVSKLGVLEHILQPHLYPELYGNMCHVVRINYYPPRGDNKEGWDNIDIFGWMGYKMQIKIDFLCRDSILAAP
ncbi:MAG: inositol-3-phosphate synthase, partial [Deltaproteobacteria bacterium]|nr:inositol-3-phosphate synthase [Deltaproteobacteria bacterium]